jgi:hypothetical protein
LDTGIGYGIEYGRFSEDIDHIHFERDLCKRAVDLLSENLIILGIDRNDLVAGLFQVFGDTVAWFALIGGESEYGDGFDCIEDMSDLLFVTVDSGEFTLH